MDKRIKHQSQIFASTRESVAVALPNGAVPFASSKTDVWEVYLVRGNLSPKLERASMAFNIDYTAGDGARIQPTLVCPLPSDAAGDIAPANSHIVQTLPIAA